MSYEDKSTLKNLKGCSIFTNFNDLRDFSKMRCGCIPFSGVGIFHKGDTAILRSVDGIDFYDDNLYNSQNPKYTLFGKSGNQSVNESKFNKRLLNFTKNIYLYRQPSKGCWIWYGKYKIVGKEIKPHIGEDKKMRNIIVLSLERVK